MYKKMAIAGFESPELVFEADAQPMSYHFWVYNKYGQCGISHLIDP